jgi:hypothetical protein
MLTPVFHPNFDEATVCIGDFWAASEGLDDLIIRIGRMIAFQEYNTKSPLNGLAAKWAEQHGHLFPVDTRDLAPPLDKPQPILAPVSVEASPQPEPSTPPSSPHNETSSPASEQSQSTAEPWNQRISIE